MTLNFDLTHDLDLGFSRFNFDVAFSQEWEREFCRQSIQFAY